MSVRERYDNLDGLRVIACFGIIAVHIQANANYRISGRIIGSWTRFVMLFLIISGFGMFCGYYDEFRGGNVDINGFYTKRYKKILPFYVFLMIIDLLLDCSSAHIAEALTQATLTFGLLPNNYPSVIGVSWTLGVIFLFYMLFPFFVYLCWNKRRAVIAIVISIMISIICEEHYFTESFVVPGFAARHSFLYCAPFFLGGGISYLCRKEIKDIVSQHRQLWCGICVILTIAWYVSPSEVGAIHLGLIKNLVLFLPWLWFAMSVKSKILSNKITRYLSEISLHMYLGHMMIYRVIEKMNCLYVFGDGWGSFLAAYVAIVVGLIFFIRIWKIVWESICKKIHYGRSNGYER